MVSLRNDITEEEGQQSTWDIEDQRPISDVRPDPSNSCSEQQQQQPQAVKGILRSSSRYNNSSKMDNTAAATKSSKGLRRQTTLDTVESSFRRSSTSDEPEELVFGRGSVYERHQIFEEGEDKESVEMVSKWIMGIAQVLTFAIIVSTFIHKAKEHHNNKNKNKTSPPSSFENSTMPPIDLDHDDYEGAGGGALLNATDFQFLFNENDVEDAHPMVEAEGMAASGGINVYEKIKDLLAEEVSLQQEIDNAQTKAQQGALQDELGVLEELEDAEVQEWSELDEEEEEDATTNNAETTTKDGPIEDELQITSEQEENLQDQAVLLDQEAHAETKEQINSLKQQLEALQARIEELEQEKNDIETKRGRTVRAGGS